MPTELFRDDHGIPHLRADDHLALAYAQGRVTAHDRGWQLQTDRLHAEGRLASLIGPAGVAWDVFAHRARLADTAQRAYHALDPEVRAWVDAYSAGVRDGLRDRRPVEFELLTARYGDEPRLDPWPDWAPLGVLHATHILFGGTPALFWRAHVAATLGDAAVDLFTTGDLPLSAGSNAWALHGSRTATGAPLLAGDPHRALELPGVYQQIRLACPEFDVVGLAFPGVPGIAHFGHAGHAAWGITNATAHGMDVFAERLRRAGDGYQALGPDGWRPAAVVGGTVEVRGGDPVSVEAIETERGPVVTDLRPDGDLLLGYSLRPPARVEADLGFGALLPLLRARTAEDVVAAFGRWVDPVNRLLAADTSGTVLSATVGRVPDRPQPERRLPLDPASAAPVGSRAMPAAVEVRDVAVDANERPDRPGIDLGWDYPAGYRADRIRELLDQLRPRAVDELGPVWGDVSPASVPELLAFLPPADRLDPPVRAVRDELADWDGALAADSTSAGRFAAWRTALTRRVVADPALEPLRRPHGLGELFDPWFAVPPRVAAVLPRLLRSDLLAQDADALVLAALRDAAAEPPRTWGDRHRLRPVHLLGRVPEIPTDRVPGSALDPGLAGDNDTVRCTGLVLGVSDDCFRGSVARWAWDLADRERSRWNVPFGASGDPGSPHFADQLPDWVAVEPVPVVTDWTRLHPDPTWPTDGP